MPSLSYTGNRPELQKLLDPSVRERLPHTRSEHEMHSLDSHVHRALRL